MAKSASADPVAQVLTFIDRIEKKGEILGERASHLSDVVAFVDARLNQMAGKVEAFARDGDVVVSFERDGGWRLLINDEESGYTADGDETSEALTSVSVARKARRVPRVAYAVGAN